MKGKIKFFQKCVAFRPSVLGMRTRSSEGVIMVFTGFPVIYDITVSDYEIFTFLVSNHILSVVFVMSIL